MGCYYPFTHKGYSKDYVKIVKEYEKTIDTAFARLCSAYTGLYRCLRHKSIIFSRMHRFRKIYSNFEQADNTAYLQHIGQGAKLMKYKEWLNIWLENYIKPSAKERTYIRYEQLIRTHIVPKIGETDVNDLTPIVLQSFVTELLNTGNLRTGKELSPNFVNTVISVIQNSLKTANMVGIATEYTANKIKRPKTVEKQVNCFTVLEQKKIENYVLNSKKDKLFGIVLCLYTGLRIGELLALTWDDIDFGKGLLFVSKSCHDGNDGHNHIRIIDTPKTAQSHRVIPLPKQILPLLKGMNRRSKCEYIVADGDKPVFVRSYQRTFEFLLKKLNIPHKGFHSLRHTFATRAIECGIDVKTLAELLGHKNATITLNRYAHSLLEHKVDMMNRLGKLL